MFPPGSYYLMIAARYNNQTLVWGILASAFRIRQNRDVPSVCLIFHPIAVTVAARFQSHARQGIQYPIVAESGEPQSGSSPSAPPRIIG